MIWNPTPSIFCFASDDSFYWYYKNKNSLSEYLAIQADFLEMHRLAVQNSKTHSSSEKREIIKKQERVILKLRRASDKLAIKNESSELQ